MSRALLLRACAASLVAGSVACSLVVDSSDIDRGCGPSRKLCGAGHCVDIDDPAYGCDPLSCEPCRLHNAVPMCASDHSCQVSACLFGFGCPSPSGCEDFLFVEPNNCGGCGNVCATGETCVAGTCTPS